MPSCCCQLHNPHQQPQGKITSPHHDSYFRGKASYKSAWLLRSRAVALLAASLRWSGEVGGASAKRTSACGANPFTLICSSPLIAFQGCIRAFCNVNCVSVHHKSLSDGSSGWGGGWHAWFGRAEGKELQGFVPAVWQEGAGVWQPQSLSPKHTGPKRSSQGSEKLLKCLTFKLFCLRKHSGAK